MTIGWVLLIVTVIDTIFLGLIIFIMKRNADGHYQRGRLEGRGAGWRACEDMAIQRAKEHGYDIAKFLEDILQ